MEVQTGWRNVRRDQCQKSSSKVRRRGLQEDIETNNVEWLGDGGTVQQVGGRNGEGRVKDAEILCKMKRMDRIRNMKGTSQIGCFGDKVRETR